MGGIEQLALVPGRMEIIDEGQGFPVIVDYAHTPDALSRLLDAVKDCQGAKRIITVVGCGGDRDRGKRPLMAEVAHYKVRDGGGECGLWVRERGHCKMRSGCGAGGCVGEGDGALQGEIGCSGGGGGGGGGVWI